MGNGGELRAISSRIIIQFEERDSKKLHVFWDGEDLLLWHLNEKQFLALFWLGDVSWDEGIHKGLEVWPPPLRQAVSDLPVIVHAVRIIELQRPLWRRESIVEALLQT